MLKSGVGRADAGGGALGRVRLCPPAWLIARERRQVDGRVLLQDDGTVSMRNAWPDMRFTRSGSSRSQVFAHTVPNVGLRDWIEESRFVASLAGYALTGDTLHQGPNTWPVAGVRADVFDDTVRRVSRLGTTGSDGLLLHELPADPTIVVVQLTLADDMLILIEVPTKKLEQAHFFARKINQAGVYFAAKTNTAPNAAHTR